MRKFFLKKLKLRVYKAFPLQEQGWDGFQEFKTEFLLQKPSPPSLPLSSYLVGRVPPALLRWAMRWRRGFHPPYHFSSSTESPLP